MTIARPGQTVRQVTVGSIDLTTGIATCTEKTTGHTLSVPLIPARSMMWPQPGQTWLIDKSLNSAWSFAGFLGGPRLAVTGTRSGADDVSLSVLDALVALGLVADQTV